VFRSLFVPFFRVLVFMAPLGQRRVPLCRGSVVILVCELTSFTLFLLLFPPFLVYWDPSLPSYLPPRLSFLPHMSLFPLVLLCWLRFFGLKVPQITTEGSEEGEGLCQHNQTLNYVLPPSFRLSFSPHTHFGQSAHRTSG